MQNEITCYGQIHGASSWQEHYESASRHAGRRARALRKAGFQVLVSPMGQQVTSVGRVGMTMLTIMETDTAKFDSIPAVKIERL